ncbi:hypothetical protein DFP72DRAFT_1175298 [Ephemerocybe angulata]|uniref:Uncharacterized protein n=1 Tax=Ephemerocybe angulata TaxID=980116 RepID=A0A8H6HH29_9AGAR|nr:hypothetical protein DFP72DRAFT_1175298 [Tulosesus angulatus]
MPSQSSRSKASGDVSQRLTNKKLAQSIVNAATAKRKPFTAGSSKTDPPPNRKDALKASLGGGGKPSAPPPGNVKQKKPETSSSSRASTPPALSTDDVALMKKKIAELEAYKVQQEIQKAINDIVPMNKPKGECGRSGQTAKAGFSMKDTGIPPARLEVIQSRMKDLVVAHLPRGAYINHADHAGPIGVIFRIMIDEFDEFKHGRFSRLWPLRAMLISKLANQRKTASLKKRTRQYFQEVDQAEQDGHTPPPPPNKKIAVLLMKRRAASQDFEDDGGDSDSSDHSDAAKNIEREPKEEALANEAEDEEADGLEYADPSNSDEEEEDDLNDTRPVLENAQLWERLGPCLRDAIIGSDFHKMYRLPKDFAEYSTLPMTAKERKMFEKRDVYLEGIIWGEGEQTEKWWERTLRGVYPHDDEFDIIWEARRVIYLGEEPAPAAPENDDIKMEESKDASVSLKRKQFVEDRAEMKKRKKAEGDADGAFGSRLSDVPSSSPKEEKKERSIRARAPRAAKA